MLNDYLKFERKIYQLFGISLGRPISLKTVLYYVVCLVIELIIYFTPIIGVLIHWLPAIYLILIPAVFAYLLSGIRTEGRSSIAFFRSFILYRIRKFQSVTYRRGREIKKPMAYRFEGYSTITFHEERNPFVPKRFKFKKKKVSISKYFEKEMSKYVDVGLKK